MTVRLDVETNLCRFLHAPLVPAEAGGHQRPAVRKVLPTASAVLPVLDHFGWTHILVGRISSVKWTGVRPVALRLGVIVFAPFQI